MIQCPSYVIRFGLVWVWVWFGFSYVIRFGLVLLNKNWQSRKQIVSGQEIASLSTAIGADLH